MSGAVAKLSTLTTTAWTGLLLVVTVAAVATLAGVHVAVPTVLTDLVYALAGGHLVASSPSVPTPAPSGPTTPGATAQ